MRVVYIYIYVCIYAYMYMCVAYIGVPSKILAQFWAFALSLQYSIVSTIYLHILVLNGTCIFVSYLPANPSWSLYRWIHAFYIVVGLNKWEECLKRVCSGQLHLFTFNGVHISRFFGAQNIPGSQNSQKPVVGPRPKTRCQQNAVPVAPPNPMDFAGVFVPQKKKLQIEFGPIRKSLPNHDISFKGCASFESEKNISTWNAWLAHKNAAKIGQNNHKDKRIPKTYPWNVSFLVRTILE